MRADRLNLAVVGLAERADGLEVLLTGPALGQDGQRQVDLDVGHGCDWECRAVVMQWGSSFYTSTY